MALIYIWNSLWKFYSLDSTVILTCFLKTSYLNVSRNVSKHCNQQVWKGVSVLVNSLILQNSVAAHKLPVRKSSCNTPNYQTVPMNNCRAGKSKLAQANSMCRTINTILAPGYAHRHPCALLNLLTWESNHGLWMSAFAANVWKVSAKILGSFESGRTGIYNKSVVRFSLLPSEFSMSLFLLHCPPHSVPLTYLFVRVCLKERKVMHLY